MAGRTCSLPNCNSAHCAKGLCRSHYMQKYNRARVQSRNTNTERYRAGSERANRLMDNLHKCLICKELSGSSILCNLCKQGLKLFRYNPGLINEAISYLRTPPLGEHKIRFIPGRPGNAKRTRMQYDEVVTLLGEHCNICGGVRETHRLDRDHDHMTGFLRGLLCNNCNIGLGRFKEDIAILEQALLYLSTANSQLI